MHELKSILLIFLQMIYLYAEEFPMSLAMSLAAISADFSQNRDRMSRACLATICELGLCQLFCSFLLRLIVGSKFCGLLPQSIRTLE